MDIRVKSSLYKEKELLKELLDKLNKQYKLLTSKDKDFILINNVADDMDSLIKSIAVIELERRKIISNEELIELVENLNEYEFIELIKDISKLKQSIEAQNEQNTIFIKQNLFFTRKMLKMITPSQQFDTYNINGRLGAK